MKKMLSGVFIFAFLIVAGAIAPAHAGVNVNINIPLPGFVFPAEPGLIVIPGSYVYYPPESNVEIFFYHGYWYRPYESGWYIANGYNGPWRTIGQRRVPAAVISIPREYRRMPPGHERMPYGQVKKNWRSWENERRWDNHEHERGDRRRENGHAEHGHGRGHGKWDD